MMAGVIRGSLILVLLLVLVGCGGDSLSNDNIQVDDESYARDLGVDDPLRTPGLTLINPHQEMLGNPQTWNIPAGEDRFIRIELVDPLNSNIRPYGKFLLSEITDVQVRAFNEDGKPLATELIEYQGVEYLGFDYLPNERKETFFRTYGTWVGIVSRTSNSAHYLHINVKNPTEQDLTISLDGGFINELL